MSEPAAHTDPHRLLRRVPLFPLPNVVHFPGTILPLHIFEERYKQMTADALAGDRRLAMALLRPGWEKDYYCRPAIESVVCLGQIVSHEKLPDGKYNFLLQGLCRARIIAEHRGEPYRTADLEILTETPAMEIDLSEPRRQLLTMLSTGPLAEAPVTRPFARLLAGSAPTAQIADAIAFGLLEDIGLKQSLLAETDVARRVRRVVVELRRLRPMLEAVALSRDADSDMDASLN